MKRILFLLFLLSCSAVPNVSFDNGASFAVEIARTNEEKAKGLMHQESMPAGHGMLFVFDRDAPREFWMKNTLIPLDIIFINSELKVVEIKANVQPCKETPCPTYPSEPAKYVLEINSGLAEKMGIKLGSTMSLSE